jgi:ubiquinone/menaquinone biosynthesis C-methylase UbiE
MPKTIDFVVADWKDTEHLLKELQRVLKLHGIVLQSWDMQTDDIVVTVARRKLTPVVVAREFNALMESTDEPYAFTATEVKA